MLMASAQVNLQQYAAALANVREVLRVEPSNVGGLTLLAVCLNTGGRPDQGRVAAQTATELRPSAPEAWAALSVSLAMLSDLKGATEAATRALSLDPANTQARYVRAGSLARLGERDRAAEDCRVLLKAQPDLEAARQLLRECEQGQTASAPPHRR
jgi:Flp pilus assembly protein TadD